MSLVNQVLKDLERRRETGSDAGGLRAAARRRPRRWPQWLVAGALALALGFGVYYADRMLRQHSPAEVPPPVVAVAEPAAATVEPPPALPRITRAATTTRENALSLALEFDGAVEPRHFTLSLPHRLVIDLPGVDTDARPGVPVPGGQAALLEAHYEDAPDGALRLVLTLSDDASASVETPAPDVVLVALETPAPRPEPPPRRAAAQPADDPVSTPAIPPPATEADGTQSRTLVTRSPQQRAAEAYNEGVRALTEGRAPRAEAQFRDALGHDASLHTARLALANLLYQQGRLQDAEVQLQEGLRIAPGEPTLADRYARLLLERGDLSGAIGVLATAPPPVDTHPGHHALLAALLQRAGNHEAAAAAYTELVGMDERQGLWWMGLGISMEALARPDAALQAYRQAIRDPRLSVEVARFVRERADALSLGAGRE